MLLDNASRTATGRRSDKALFNFGVCRHSRPNRWRWDAATPSAGDAGDSEDPKLGSEERRNRLLPIPRFSNCAIPRG